MPRPKLRKNAIARYTRQNPRRSPRWRYDRVRHILDRRETGHPRECPDPQEDDEFIRLAFNFLRKWEKVNQYDMDPTDLERRRQMELYDENPGLYFAYEAYQAPKEDKTRCHIEAHILARRNNEEIGRLTDHTPDTIEWYEKLFFNVRERLHNKTYIDAQVLLKAVNCGLQNLNLQLLAKFWGYYGGPYALDYFLHGIPSFVAQPGPNTDMSKYMVDMQNFDLVRFSMNATKALSTGDVNQFNYFDLVAAQNQIVSIVSSQKAETGTHTPLEETVAAVLGGLQWVVGMDGRERMQGTRLGQFLGHQAEPRADDQLRIAAGLEVEYTPEELAARALPPPPPKEGMNKDATVVEQDS